MCAAISGCAADAALVTENWRDTIVDVGDCDGLADYNG